MNTNKKRVSILLLLTFAITLNSPVFSQVKDYATDANLSIEVRTFLKKLNAGGQTVESTVRYNSVIHDFRLLNALAEIP